MASFIFGGNTNETAESLARKREIAKALLEGATGRAPQNIGEGLTAVGQAIAGRAIERRAMRGQEEGRQKATEAFRSLLGGSTSGSATASMSPTMSAPASSAGANSYRDAIASIESQGSGDYAAVGPTHPELGRALGRYQVMEANIGPWSQEALGREVSAEEFMANPQLQDAIFDHQFGKYVQQYGPDGAAQAWFGGPGGVGKTNRQDSLGTSIGEYTNKFNAALGSQPAAQAINQNFNGMDALPQQAQPQPNARPWAGGGMNVDIGSTRPAPQRPAPLAPQAFDERFTGQPAPDPMPTASTPPVDPLQSQLQAFDPQSKQLENADPNQGILRALLGGGRPAQGEFPPAPGSVPMPQTGPMGGLDPRLIELASNPFLPPEMRAVVGSMIEQQMQSADPMRQMEMERARLELEQLRNPRPDPTDDMREYNFAVQQGYQGSFQQFLTDMRKASSSSVNVNMPGQPNIGTIPQGYEAVQDPQSGAWQMRPIPGGPVAQEQEAAARARESAQQQSGTYGNIVLQDISRARDLIENSPWYSPTTGMLGNILKDVGGTNAADVQELTRTIRSNIGFDRLQAMREASPTGGALGNVTERELTDLQATLGSLAQVQSEPQLLANLERLNQIYTSIHQKASAYPNAADFGFTPIQGQPQRGSRVQAGSTAAAQSSDWQRDTLRRAQEAVNNGKDPDAVRQLLEQNGFITDGLEWLN